MSEECIEILDELILLQEAKVYNAALRINPYVTKDDILQPNDFPELELHPHFRYEEGILEGLRSAKAALYTGSRSIVNP